MEEKRITLRLPLEAMLYLERARDITGKSQNQLIVDAITAMYCPSGDTMTPVTPDTPDAPVTQQKLDLVLALLRQHSDRLTALEKSKVTPNGVMVSLGQRDDATKVPIQMPGKEFKEQYQLSDADYGSVTNDARARGSWVSPDGLRWRVTGSDKRTVWTQVV
ncbi:MAG: hypothetical protein AB1589_35130 [Cyanobacteriota bacterium]